MLSAELHYRTRRGGWACVRGDYAALTQRMERLKTDATLYVAGSDEVLGEVFKRENDSGRLVWMYWYERELDGSRVRSAGGA